MDVTPLRSPVYRRLLGAQLASAAGTWMQLVTVSWLVLERTGSALWTASVTTAALLPSLLLAGVAGRLADTRDRRRVVALTSSAASTVAVLLAVVEAGPGAGPEVLVLGTLLLGAAGALSHPAYLSLVPDYVGARHVPTAVLYEATAFNLAKVLGPLLGGGLLAAGRPALAFLVNATSFAVVAAVAAAAPRPGHPTATSMTHQAPGGGLPRHVRLLAGYALLGGTVQVALPPAVQASLHESADVYAVLLAAFAVGGAVTVVGLRSLRERLPQGRELPASIAGMCGAHALAAAALLVSSVPLLAVAVLVAGFCWVWGYGTVQSVLQVATAADRRGAALAAYLRAGVGGAAVGSLAAGWTIDRTGPLPALLMAAAGLLVLALRARAAGLLDLGGRVRSDQPVELEAA